jgi:hypothetical protein
MNDMIKEKDTKHMIVPFDDQTAVCRTACTVVWEGLALRASLYPIVIIGTINTFISLMFDNSVIGHKFANNLTIISFIKICLSYLRLNLIVYFCSTKLSYKY